MLSEQEVLERLRAVLDPELGINIVDLGLVYGVKPQGRTVEVRITMTTPACPLSETLVADIKAALRNDADAVDVQLVWDPPWKPDRMSADAKRQLGWKGA